MGGEKSGAVRPRAPAEKRSAVPGASRAGREATRGAIPGGPLLWRRGEERRDLGVAGGGEERR